MIYYPLSSYLDAEVTMKANEKGKGQLIVAFKNEADLQRILNRIKSEN